MNKKLITLAASTVLVGSTSAFADVTVYGQLHMSMDYTNTQVKAASGQVGDKQNIGISSNSSRLGFKGNEDLGSGLKGIWQIESGVSMDGKSTSTLGTRNTFLGLAGGFGTVLLGKHDTPFKMLSRSLDPFTDTIADTRQLLGNEEMPGTASWELRPGNVLAYITPDFNGFTAVLAYVTGLDNSKYTDKLGYKVGGADNNKLTAFSMNATYKNGPIYAGLAYESHNVKESLAAGAKNPSAWRLGGSYEFGTAKVGAMWESLSKVDGFNLDRTAWTLFGTYGFGMETVKLAYTQANKWENGDSKLDSTAAGLWALGIDHKFSKRTTAYAQYTSLNNDKNAAYVLGSGGGYGDEVATRDGKDPNAFSVGLIHKF